MLRLEPIRKKCNGQSESSRLPTVFFQPTRLTLRGRRWNEYEANLFLTVDARRRAMLCPVRWCSAGGRLLASASARPLSKADQEELLAANGFPDWDYMPGEDGQPFEFKASDWGRLNGRLVALDYSTPGA
jgi:hypothetical protein